MTRSTECVCAVQDHLTGSAARHYAASHLVLDAAPAWIGEVGQEIYSREVAVDWTCPATGWQWHGNLWSTGFELRRRPRTSRADYLSHAVVAERADAVARSSRDIHHFYGRDPSAWHAATIRGWVAHEALYSPHWWEIVEDLRLGRQSSVDPALVFLEVDPWCFRSGYAKEQVLRFLRRPVLHEAAISRLRPALLRSVVAGPRREYPLVVRLAHHIASDEFGDEIRRMASEATTEDARRHVLQLLP